MKKAALYLFEIGKRILFIGFGIQIILGIIWMCFNFTNLQEYSIPGAFLYRYVIRGFREIFPVLYLLQLAVAFYAGYFLMHELHFFTEHRVAYEVIGSMAFLTFPMAMQCHIAISPCSFAGSLVLIAFALAIRIIRKREVFSLRDFAKLGLCWLLLSLLLPEYILLGGIPLLIVIFFRLNTLVRSGYRWIAVLLMLCAFSGLVAGSARLTGQENPVRKENLAFSIFQRTSWMYLVGDSGMWDAELLSAVKQELIEASVRPEAMETALRPRLEELFTDAEFIDFCMERSWVNLRFHGSAILRHVMWDGCGYAFTPLIVPLQWAGNGYDSLTGYNYEIMRRQVPILSRYYMLYSCRWFLITLVVSAICFPAYLLQRGGVIDREESCRSIAVPCLLMMGLFVLFYALRSAGMMDYKCSFAINQMWMAGAMYLWRKVA